jgi:hypothetical protein
MKTKKPLKIKLPSTIKQNIQVTNSESKIKDEIIVNFGV